MYIYVCNSDYIVYMLLFCVHTVELLHKGHIGIHHYHCGEVHFQNLKICHTVNVIS